MRTKACILLLPLLMGSGAALGAEQDQLMLLRSQVNEAFGDDFTVLAVCGSSTGKVLYQDQLTLGWQDDAIPNGRLVFMVGPSNVPNVIYQDATGRLLSAVQEGGIVSEVFRNPDRGEVLWTTVYKRTGVTETYSISNLSTGAGRVYWTSAKPSVDYPTEPVTTIGPKVSAFSAECI